MSGDGQKVLSEIDQFDKKNLKQVSTDEKAVLPDATAIQQEKSEVQLRDEIAKGLDLKHVQTEEKVVLPTKEDIQAERRLSQTS